MFNTNLNKYFPVYTSERDVLSALKELNQLVEVIQNQPDQDTLCELAAVTLARFRRTFPEVLLLPDDVYAQLKYAAKVLRTHNWKITFTLPDTEAQFWITKPDQTNLW